MSVSQAELRWKCRRGMLELDLLLSRFIDNHYSELDTAQLDQLVQLLEYPDQVLQGLLVNGSASSDPNMDSIITLIRESQRRSLDDAQA